MQSILRSLYNGRIIPWERTSQYSEKQLALLSTIEKEEHYFLDKLPIEDQERFQKLSDLRSEWALCEEDDLFSYAFSLGALLMLDVAAERQNICKL